MTPLTTARLTQMIEAAEQADTQFIAQCANHGTAVYLSHLDPRTIIALCQIALAAAEYVEAFGNNDPLVEPYTELRDALREAGL